jgi:LysR family transcriptional regulator, hydrogen peroxide-inducible genes activator
VSGPFAAGHGVTIKHLPKPSPHRIVGAIWRKSSTRTKAIRAVCGVIAETAG